MTVADLLEWEAWPEEMQRIARLAVREEIEHSDETATEVEETEAWADAMWAAARKHLAIVIAKLKEGRAQLEPVTHLAGAIDDADTSFNTALEMLEALPEEIADLEALEE